MTLFAIILFAVLCSEFVSSVQGAKEILFAGDSDIDRWKNTDTLYPNSVNQGISGSTCRQWLKKIDRKVDKYRPSTVVLVCGENDLIDRNVNQVFKDFSAVVENIFAKGVDRIIYLGTKPEPDTTYLHGDYGAYDNLIWDKLVNERNGFVMIDVNPSFVALGNKRNLYDNDGLHLSDDKGYALWNTWLQSALSDSGCIWWKEGNCVLRNNEVEDNNINKESPSESPTSSPSETSSSTSSCSDDQDFRYRKNNKSFDCNWVANKPGKRCNKKYQGKKLRFSCSQSCGDC